MLAAWARGDVKAIARTFNHDLAASPELKAGAAHAPQRQLEPAGSSSAWRTPGSVMVAVGAGHLAGKDSVVEMLKQDGYGPPRPIDRARSLPRSVEKNSHFADFARHLLTPR